MITFASITPHPPIILPEIGQQEDIEQVKNTIAAMQRLGQELTEAQPDTVLIISPHAPLSAGSFQLNHAETLTGDLGQFGFDRAFQYTNDLEIVNDIIKHAQEEQIPIDVHDATLDHGTLVPLYYLLQDISPNVVHCSFSMLSLEEHLAYGALIGSVCQKTQKKIALIASGDLSHRLIPSAPAGFSPKGKEFDEMLLQLLQEKRVNDILQLDHELIEHAGECGLRSFAILLGTLQQEAWECNIYHYEGPFGVGYCTARLL